MAPLVSVFLPHLLRALHIDNRHERIDRLLGLGIAENPLFTGDPVGGPFINLILLGYGIPAVLAAVLALVSRGVRPPALASARGFPRAFRR